MMPWLHAVDWEPDLCHSLCDPVPYLISLKLIYSCCPSSVCLTGPATLRPVPSLFAPSPFELHRYSSAFLGPCHASLEAGDSSRCNGLITSRCFSESNCIFEVTVLRRSHFLFPQTVQGAVWLLQIGARRRNANGQDVSGQCWLVSPQSKTRGWQRKSISC